MSLMPYTPKAGDFVLFPGGPKSDLPYRVLEVLRSGLWVDVPGIPSVGPYWVRWQEAERLGIRPAPKEST